MKKQFLALLLLLMGVVGQVSATKVFATFGTPAGNGSWDGDTQTYSWTGSYSNLMPIFTFSNGELAECTALHLTTSDYVDGPYRVCFMNGSTAVATITFYSASEKNLVLSERGETKDIDLSAITSIQFGGASGAGSVKLDPSSVYLVKPLALKFGDDGKAHITASDLDVTGNVSVDAQTGVVTSTGTGSISVSLPNCDFSGVSRIDVSRSGDDICNTMAINDAVNGNLNTWYGSKYGCDFTSYQANAGQVNKITWNVNSEGTMTISDIVITSSVIRGIDNTLVDLWSIPFHKWSGVGANESVEENNPACWDDRNKPSGTIYGDALNVNEKYYSDITGYDEMKIYADYNSLRILVNRNGSVTEIQGDGTWADGCLTLDLNAVMAKHEWSFLHLNAIKSYNTPTVTKIELTKSDVDYRYSIIGSGAMASSVGKILAIEDATIIDATGITGSNVSLVPANPNCIFVANAGALANESNVMVDNTITNYSITDGKPAVVPVGATVSAASYNREFTADYSTVCLPFAATFDGVAYECTEATSDAVTFTKVDAMEAGKAYLVEAGFAVTGGSGELAAAQGESFKGVYENTTISSGYGFSSAGAFVKITGNVTCPAFRAYLDLSSSAKSLNVNFGEEDAIKDIAGGLNSMSAVYGVNGVRQNGLQKGINIVKMANGATRKVIIK